MDDLEGEFLFTYEELQDCRDKVEHQEKVVIPTMRKIGMEDALLPSVSKVLKYPGEY
jgi:hypothetical protein